MYWRTPMAKCWAKSSMVSEAGGNTLRHLACELRGDILEQRVDIGHVTVDRAAGHASGGGEFADGDSGDAVFGKQLHRCFMNALERGTDRRAERSPDIDCFDGVSRIEHYRSLSDQPAWGFAPMTSFCLLLNTVVHEIGGAATRQGRHGKGSRHGGRFAVDAGVITPRRAARGRTRRADMEPRSGPRRCWRCQRACACRQGKTRLTGPYNILFILTDQERFFRPGELPVGYSLPAHERLKKHGTTFLNHRINSCVCTPSRSVVYTGQHIQQTGMFDNTNFPWIKSMSPEIRTIGDMLHDAGYYTAYKGKWHLTKEFETVNKLDAPTRIFTKEMEAYGFSDYFGVGDIIAHTRAAICMTGSSRRWERAGCAARVASSQRKASPGSSP